MPLFTQRRRSGILRSSDARSCIKGPPRAARMPSKRSRAPQRKTDRGWEQGSSHVQSFRQATETGRSGHARRRGDPRADRRALSRYREAMLIYSMGVSVDGFIADREGEFGWGVPSDEQFRFHLEQVRELGSCLLGRRLYETMLAWETDPSLQDNEDTTAFADAWCALPKVVFSRTLDSVQGNARLAEASVAEEVAAALEATDKDVEIGGAGLAAQAFELGLVDELRVFRYPVVVGGGTPYLPPVAEDVRLNLIESRTFDSRVIYERYRRVGGVH